VDSERQIIEEEWRSKQSPQHKIKEAYWQAAFPSHAKRMPIGQLDFIRNGSPAVLESFYKQWYVPRNMAIVCTGNGGKSCPTTTDVTQLIAEIFGSPVATNR
jgi:zinc protease